MAAGLTLGLAASFTQAAVCTVNDALTNPDASVEASSSCGAGLGNNPDEGALDTVIGPNDYVFQDKDEDEATLGSPDNGYLLTGTLFGGFWFIDTDVSNADQYIIVLKDGEIPGADYQWYWFVVDEGNSELGDNVGGCAGTAPPGFDLCGTWSMYGTGGTIKELSHTELWTTGVTVPEPGTILLLGLGLVGLGLARRRRQI